MAKKEKQKNIQIVNRKAEYEYSFVKRYESGIMLQGTEVKTLREGSANLNDAFCFFKDGELYVKNMFISDYKLGTTNAHESRRLRKLLLRGAEIKYLQKRVMEKGLTIVPYRIFFSERGFAKLEIALAQGKKSFDKRDSIKEREGKREMDRLKKSKNLGYQQRV